jgi:hypothetical protein
MARQDLYKLLQDCTVRLSSASGMGTGFFIAPGGWILTCAHVVEQSDRVEVLWRSGEGQQSLAATVQIRLPIPVDIALLQLEGKAPDHKCVYLDQSLPQLGDPLYTFGYPQGYGAESYSGGDSATTTYEGKSFQDDVLVLKLKEGQIQEGYSGSPLINVRTGKVCGIVSISRNTDSDLGGRATPIPLLFQPNQMTSSQNEQHLILAKLKANKQFHQKIDPQWRKIISPPFWARKSVLASFLAIALLSTISLFLWHWLNPWPMSKGDVFNVAITDFATVNQNGKMQRLEEGKYLSNWVKNLLEYEKKEHQSIASNGNWQISKSNKYYIKAESITELRENLESFAKSINAKILIYGYLTKTDNLDDKLLTLGFYLSPYDNFAPSTGLVDTFDNHALKGIYQIGEPQPINVRDTGESEDFLSSRVKPLFWLLAGLTYRSNPTKALKIFQQAETYLEGEWKTGAGKEVFYFCMGQVALFAANAPNVDIKDASYYAQKAENAFTLAKESNDKYLRPRIGLGSVYLTRAEWDSDRINRLPKGADPTQLQKQRDVALKAALAAYEEVVQRLPQTQPDLWSEYAAPLGLGTAWILQGYTDLDRHQDKKAEEFQHKAVAMIQPILKPLATAEEYRLLAQAYSNLGSAYWLGADVHLSQGDRKSSLDLRHKASEAFLLCKNQGEKAPNDLILNRQIAKDCLDNNQKLLETLKETKKMSMQTPIYRFLTIGVAASLILLPLVNFDRAIATTDINKTKELLADGNRPKLQKPGGVDGDLTGGILLPGDATITEADGSFIARLTNSKDFQVLVRDPKKGKRDGDGIESVTFQIFDETAGINYKHTEMKAGYCPFGGGEPKCNASQLVNHHTYRILIEVKPRDPSPLHPGASWNFKIQT